LQVLIPKGTYKGQKLTNEVSAKTAAKAPNTIAVVPEIVSVKYKTTTKIAKIKRIDLSAKPIFFFMYD
jgi:hypothetical protein